MSKQRKDNKLTGKEIRALRENLGLSLEKFAKKYRPYLVDHKYDGKHLFLVETGKIAPSNELLNAINMTFRGISENGKRKTITDKNKKSLELSYLLYQLINEEYSDKEYGLIAKDCRKLLAEILDS